MVEGLRRRQLIRWIGGRPRRLTCRPSSLGAPSRFGIEEMITVGWVGELESARRRGRPWRGAEWGDLNVEAGRNRRGRPSPACGRALLTIVPGQVPTQPIVAYPEDAIRTIRRIWAAPRPLALSNQRCLEMKPPRIGADRCIGIECERASRGLALTLPAKDARILRPAEHPTDDGNARLAP